MSPKEIVRAWIEAFNRADAEALGRLYAANAINHQVAERAIEGRAAIREMFETEFARARMICIPDYLFEIGARRCFAKRSIVYPLNRARFTHRVDA